MGAILPEKRRLTKRNGLPKETGLIAAGFVVAGLSLGFAVISIQTSGEAPTIPGNEHLLIFTRPAQSARLPLSDAIAKLRESPIDADPITTGSIGRAAARPSERPTARITAYALLQIFGDRALLQGPEGLLLAGPGTALKTGGTVAGIAQRDGKWVVSTSAGIITAER